MKHSHLRTPRTMADCDFRTDYPRPGRRRLSTAIKAAIIVACAMLYAHALVMMVPV